MILYKIINLSIIFGLSLRDLDWLMYFIFPIFPVVLIVILLYQIYINNIKKRSLNKKELIIGSICLLLVAAISMIMILDWLMYFIFLAVTTVIFLYQIYITDIKKRLLNITEMIIMIVCILLAYVIQMMVLTMTIYEIVLNYSFIGIAIIAVIVLCSIYIIGIKKRPLNKTEKIIGAICILLAFTIIVINTIINIMII